MRLEPCASSPSIAANAPTTPAARAADFLPYLTKELRRMKSISCNPPENLPVRPVGSVWLGPAVKSPRTVGV